MKAILTIQGERNKVIHPYLPSEYCPTKGYLQGPIPEGYDCLINVKDCECCYIDSVSQSPTGKPYYESFSQ